MATIPVMAEVNDCEKWAKDYQKVNGGDLIFIQPLKNNGAWDFGDYNGHWMNRAYNKTIGVYYYDPQNDVYYDSMKNIELQFEYAWNKDVAVFNYNKGEVPFGLIFHY